MLAAGLSRLLLLVRPRPGGHRRLPDRHRCALFALPPPRAGRDRRRPACSRSACSASLACSRGVRGPLARPTPLLGPGRGGLGLLTYTPPNAASGAGPFWNSWIVALLPAMGLLLRHALRSHGAHASRPGLGLPQRLLHLRGLRTPRLLQGRRGRPRDGLRDAAGPVRAAALGGRQRGLLRPGPGGVRSCLVRTGPDCWRLVGGSSSGSPGVLAPAAGAHVRILPTTRDVEAHPAIAMAVRGYVAPAPGRGRPAPPEPRRGSSSPSTSSSRSALFRRPCRSQI